MSNLYAASAGHSEAITQVSAVDQQFNRVNEQINRLESVIGELFDQLKPVLTPDRPVADCASVVGAKESQSPLSDQLGCIAYSLEANVDYLRSLLRRVEV